PAVPLRLRRPPTPPPFPYTTLFRSQAYPAAVSPAIYPPPCAAGAAGSAVAAGGIGILRRVSSPLITSANSLNGFAPDRKRPLMKDRKSTRLNSSHVSISYAVFCLKK